MKKKLLKAFTLVELIVVMVLMGIITTAIVMVMRPAQNMYTNITNKAYEEQTTLIVSKMINQELRYAAGISVVCNRVDKFNDGTDNTKTYPSVGTIGNYKHYIKLSNDYRDADFTEYNMYLKGARGSFEKGTVDSGVIKKSFSSISDETFDDYDFQFSVEGYNNKPGEESLSIGFTSNFLRASDDADAVQAATDIGKPDPSFIPLYDKVYRYTETFEFINLKKSALIGKKTTGLTLADEYKYGTPVDHLGDSNAPYYDPREAGCDNTIWIFYNLPEEAEDKDSVDPSTSTTPTSTTVSTVTLKTETSTSATETSVSGGIPGAANPGNGNGNGNTGDGNVGQGNGRDNTGNSENHGGNANINGQGNGNGNGNGNPGGGNGNNGNNGNSETTTEPPVTSSETETSAAPGAPTFTCSWSGNKDKWSTPVFKDASISITNTSGVDAKNVKIVVTMEKGNVANNLDNLQDYTGSEYDLDISGNTVTFTLKKEIKAGETHTLRGGSMVIVSADHKNGFSISSVSASGDAV